MRFFTERTRAKLGRKVTVEEAPEVLLSEQERAEAPRFEMPYTSYFNLELACRDARDAGVVEFLVESKSDGSLWAVNSEGADYPRYLACAGRGTR